MDWININTSTLDSETMLDAGPEDGWPWLLLMRYCMGQENGGRIKNCRNWDEAKWQRTVRLSRDDVDKESPLWLWDGDDLEVEFYPLARQLQVQKNRVSGSNGGRKRAANARLQAPASSAPLQAPASSAPLQRNGRVIGKEPKGREEAPALEVAIPSVADVRAWASLAGVDPDYAEKKWRDVSADHGWERNRRLIDWRAKWQGYWETDKGRWLAKKKNGAVQPPSRTPAQERFELNRELQEIRARLDACHENQVQPLPADRDREKFLQQELRALEPGVQT